MEECVKRIEYLQGGNSSLKSELSHRKISPESEVLQEALMLKKNAIEADIELATDVSEKILSGKARKTNHSLLTIANTTNQIRRSISALDKDLDIAANDLSRIQIARGLQDKSGSKKSSSKTSTSGETGKTKRGPFGLVGDDVFADDSAFKAPIVGIGNSRHSNLRKARQVAMQKQSLRTLEVVVPSINRKPALEPVAFPQIPKESVNLAEAKNVDDNEESIFDEEEYVIIDNDESTPGPESGDQSFLDEKSVGNQSFEDPSAIASTSAASQSFFALATKPLEGVHLINSAKKESLPDPVPEKSFSFGFGSATNSPAPASILHANSSSPAPSSGALTSSFPSKQKDLFSYTLPDTSNAAPPVSHSLFGVPSSSSKETGKQQPPGFSFPVATDSPANPFAQSSLPSSTSKPFSFSNAVKKETDAAPIAPAPAAPVALSFVAPVKKEEVVKPMFSFAQATTSSTASAESVSTHATKDTKEKSKEVSKPSLFSFNPPSSAVVTNEPASSSSFSGGFVGKKVEVSNEVSPQKPTSPTKVSSPVKSASPAKSPSPIKSPSPAAPSPLKSVTKDPPPEEIESDQEIENTFARQEPVAGLGNVDEDEGTAGTTAEISEVRDDAQREETFESSQIVDDAEQSGLNAIEEKPSFQLDASFAAGLSALLPDDQIVVTPEKKVSSAIEADLPTASTAKDLDAMDDDDELIIDDNKPAEEITTGTTSTSGFGGGLGGFSTQPKNTINPMFSVPASSAPSAAANKTTFSSFSSGAGGGSVFGQSAFGSTTAASSSNPFATSALSGATAPSNSFGSSSQQPQNSSFFGSQQPAQPSVFGSPAAAPLSHSHPPVLQTP